MITGAASGLGLKMSQLFAEVGARVVLADIDGNAAFQPAHGTSYREWYFGVSVPPSRRL
jgi:NAD(P)-dependent dehydrogenase (short-subunit alcohol dehydrogenase family)